MKLEGRELHPNAPSIVTQREYGRTNQGTQPAVKEGGRPERVRNVKSSRVSRHGKVRMFLGCAETREIKQGIQKC